MSSLRERLKAKTIASESVIVDGDSYQVRGLTKLARGKLFAKSRKKDGSVNTDMLEGLLLTACVCDPETQQPLFQESEIREWDSVPSHVTGPLVAAVMQVCGLDKQDLSDPKDSDSTES